MLGNFGALGNDALSLSLFVWGARDHLMHKKIDNL
jgi:hypothetical protein